MTILDVDSLSSPDLIVQYVVECRGKGHFLPYADHQIIQEWLALAPHPDHLLLVLAEVLPEYFEKDRQAGRPPRALSGVRLKVRGRLKDQAMRVAETR